MGCANAHASCKYVLQLSYGNRSQFSCKSMLLVAAANVSRPRANNGFRCKSMQLSAGSPSRSALAREGRALQMLCCHPVYRCGRIAGAFTGALKLRIAVSQCTHLSWNLDFIIRAFDLKSLLAFSFESHQPAQCTYTYIE